MSTSDFRSQDEQAAAETGAALDESATGRDPGPVDDAEAQGAAEGLEAPTGTAENYREMLERGAAQKGEGQIP